MNESQILFIRSFTLSKRYIFFDFLFFYKFINQNVGFNPVIYKERIYYLKDFSQCGNHH